MVIVETKLCEQLNHDEATVLKIVYCYEALVTSAGQPLVVHSLFKGSNQRR